MIALSAALWLAVAVLVLFCIFAVREVLIWLIAAVFSEPDNQVRRAQVANTINFVQQCLTIILGVLGLGIVLGGGEHFFNHIGQPRLIRNLLIVLPVATIVWL